ncbi:segregation/condensation protein A [Candidatus Woesearchaeota archaeon]|nr:segregation/condensation protein A [Candidatus Woesearchaeota archaeon]
MSQDRILNLLMQKDEITWQTILHDLVKSGEINPWDIDISILANKYLDIVKKLQEANLFISGKVLLASAILLKIKSEKLIVEDIGVLDNLMFPAPMEELDQFMDPASRRIILDIEPKLTIKTPQARKKRVQIDDLISALERALEVNQRRLLRIADRNSIPANLSIPEKKIDITKLIMELYDKIKLVFTKKDNLTFSELVPSGRKEDKIITFVPLLHLSNQEKVDLEQKEHFGEINIKLIKSL